MVLFQHTTLLLILNSATLLYFIQFITLIIPHNIKENYSCSGLNIGNALKMFFIVVHLCACVCYHVISENMHFYFSIKISILQ